MSRIFTPATLAEIFKLRKGDIEELIQTSAIPQLDFNKERWVGYLPSLKSSFELDDSSRRACLQNINNVKMVSSLEKAVVSLASGAGNISASSFLFSNNWVNYIKEHLDITEEIYVLISSRNDLPVFCGHKDTIKRLGTNFSGDILIYKALDLEEHNVLG